MTFEERIAKAKEEINSLWAEADYWEKRSGEDSEQYKMWCARWVAASDIFYVITGERYLSE